MQCSKGNSPSRYSSGGGNRSRARNGGRLAPTCGIIDDVLQRSADNEISQSGGGATHRRMTWRWIGVVRPPMERQRARVVARVLLFAYQDLT
jgi:hypothetical protein